MKAAVFYILFLCFGLLCAHNHAHSTLHSGKISVATTHNIVHKQQVDANNLIDVEDENDDKDVAKKFPNQAKWISTCVITAIFNAHNLSAINLSDNYLPDPTGAQICIEHRVLRI
jgi:hypothetical protein